MEQWQQALTDYTGRWAFVLSLSKRMIFGLECIRDAKPLERETGHFIPILKSLERRGLVEHWNMPADPAIYTGPRWGWKITPAGDAVCTLLVLAGQMSKPRIRVENAA